MKPSCCLSDLVRKVKKSSSKFISEKKLTKYSFAWRSGYGAFSYSLSSLDHVNIYKKSKGTSQSKNVRDEYKEFLTKFNIEHKDDFLFEWI